MVGHERRALSFFGHQLTEPWRDTRRRDVFFDGRQLFVCLFFVSYSHAGSLVGWRKCLALFGRFVGRGRSLGGRVFGEALG